MRRTVTLAAFVGLLGCAQPERPGPTTNFGDPLIPGSYEPHVERMIADKLVDPESARFRFGPPQRVVVNDAPIRGGRIIFTGYVVPVEVNARNRMGGYVGFSPWHCLVRNGLVWTCNRGNYYAMQSITTY